MSSIRLRLFTGLALIGSLGVSALLRAATGTAQTPRPERTPAREELARTAQLSSADAMRMRARSFSADEARGVE